MRNAANIRHTHKFTAALCLVKDHSPTLPREHSVTTLTTNFNHGHNMILRYE